MGTGNGRTIAEVLLGSDPIVRGMSTEQQQQHRVAMPKPRVKDIDAIVGLYESNAGGTAVWTAAQRALPYSPARASYDCILETGTTLSAEAPSRILQSFAADHGNEVVAELIKRKEIGQLSKMPRGNLSIKVKTDAARTKLEGQEVTILGHRFKFRERDPLEHRYYIDIAGVSSDSDVNALFSRLFNIGAKPLYATNREVHLKAGITTATLRVYFVDQDVPDALVINGGVVNQIVFKQRLHFATGKGAAPPATRPRFGYRSEHCLDLDLVDTPKKGTTTTSSKKQHENKSNSKKNNPGGGQTKGLVPNQTQGKPPQDAPEQGSNAPDQGSSGPSGSDIVPGTAQMQSMEIDEETKQASGDESMNGGSGEETNKHESGDESMSGNKSDGEAADSGSSTSTASPGSTSADSGGYTVVRSKKRRFFEDAQAPMPNPIALLDWTTTNFYATLAEVPATFEMVEHIGAASPTEDPVGLFQAIPVLYAPVPRSVTSSACKTKRMREYITSDGSRVDADDDWVAMEEFCKQLQDDVDKAAQHNEEVIKHQVANLPRAQKYVDMERNVDKIIEDILRQPWTYSHVFQIIARDQDPENSALESLADLHAFDRLLAGRTPDIVQAYTLRQCITSQRSAPTRKGVRQQLEQWFQDSDTQGCDLSRLFEEWRALAFFELMLLVCAPTIMRSDAWMQLICKQKVEWIPHRHVRLLKTPLLLHLLRSHIGREVLQRFEQIDWSSPMLSTMQRLRTNPAMYDGGYEPTLQTGEDGQPQLHIVTAQRC